MSFFISGTAPDAVYRNTRDGVEPEHARGREYLEQLWREGSAYIDIDAAEKATRDLVSVFWELQLVNALRTAGKKLLIRQHLAYKKNKGPDLCAEGDPKVWIEAVVVRCGTGPDALKSPEMMKAYRYSADGVVLRLRSVILDKSLKLQNYMMEGIIKPGEATIIAVSGVMLPHRSSGVVPPEIVRAVYPVNNPVMELNPTTGNVMGSHVEYRDRVKKNLGAEVATDIFLNPEFSHVSAVLFDDVHWFNPPDPPGADFKIVHNSAATIPLPDGWLTAGREYWWREGAQLESRQH